MQSDPFERFERSRAGLLIPVLVFVLGALATSFAVRVMDDLVVLENPREVEGAHDEMKPMLDPASGKE